MADKGNRINWEIDSGQIMLVGDGKEERIFAVPPVFIEAFREEIINTAGKATFKMMIRKTLETLGGASGDDKQYDWEDFEKYNDTQILPVALDESQIPKDLIAWDGSSRNLALVPDYNVSIWTVNSFNTLKSVLEDIMTPKGANAILQSAGKKAGMATGELSAKFLGWKSIDDILNTFDEHYRNLSPIMGWSRSRASFEKDDNGEAVILLKLWNSFESRKDHDSTCCVLTSSFFTGNLHKIAEIIDQKTAAEGREVKCASQGGDYCAIAIKLKSKDSPHTDWKELEATWKKIEDGSKDLLP